MKICLLASLPLNSNSVYLCIFLKPSKINKLLMATNSEYKIYFEVYIYQYIILKKNKIKKYFQNMC
jgi:hypothetical protein